MIIILFLTIIYTKLGLFVTTQILICLIVYFLSNFLIGINPFRLDYYLFRIFTLLIIILLIYYHTDSEFAISCLLPFSTDKITFFDSIEDYKIEDKPQYFILRKLDQSSILDFYDILDYNTNYVLEIEFILNIKHNGEENMPRLDLSYPIIVNKYSSISLLLKFLNAQLFLMNKYFYPNNIIQFQKNRG